MVERKEKMGKKVEYCGLMLGSDYYALPVLQVQEVVRPMNVTPVPKSQEFVKGLINLRGQIVTVIDLKLLLGLEKNDLSSGDTEEHKNIIIRMPDASLISFVVDKILDVFEVDFDDLEKVPDTLTTKLKDNSLGVYKLNEKIFVLLDIDKLINF